MATIVNFQNEFEMPLTLQSLDDFRRWTHTEAFPDVGRIDYVVGRIEVDMSPEDLFTHGTPKTEIAARLHARVKHANWGHVFIDRTRVASVTAKLSAEPDIVLVSRQSLKSGQVRLVPKASGQPDRFVEIEGAADLVIEIISDSSEHKDTELLPTAYFQAGVHELWLIDVRGAAVQFRIYVRGTSEFEAVTANMDGFCRSAVMAADFRLERTRDDDGYWRYDLIDDGSS